MKKKIIGIDIDGVVADLLPVWITLYNLDSGDTLDYKTINKWGVEEFVKDGWQDKIFKYISDPHTYNFVEAIPNSLWGVKKLREFGYRTVFITSTPVGCSGRKLKWLSEWGYDVKINDYIEASDKSIIATDYLIDDYDRNIKTAMGTGIIFDAPYNKTLQGYYRAYNWTDIINYFIFKDGD